MTTVILAPTTLTAMVFVQTRIIVLTTVILISLTLTMTLWVMCVIQVQAAEPAVVQTVR
jgi:hypothetical protein